MNILYKYCDSLGSIKILASLELKLPFIADVNDPYEVKPVYYCKKDKTPLENRILHELRRRGVLPRGYSRQEVLNAYRLEDLSTELIRGIQELWMSSNRENCLLSVSKNCSNTAMWAHYAEEHQGVVFGIDFDDLFCEDKKTWGIKMYPVKYVSERLRIDIQEDLRGARREVYREVLMTKSMNWKHEEEFRSLFARKSQYPDGTTLESLQNKGLAVFRELNGRKTWFLRLNPFSIRSIIFGINSDESLKQAIRKLAANLKNVRFYQVRESETYNFDLVEI